MDSKRVALGLQSLGHPSLLSTAPASPTDDIPARKSTSRPQAQSSTTTARQIMAPQYSTVASLSIGPAVQQVVTTTITTTTVTMPPITIKPPRGLHDRDPKQYPLAFSPTPHALKRFSFDVNGRPTSFHECEDAEETLRRYHELQAKISEQNGCMRKEEKRGDYDTPVRSSKQPSLSTKAPGVEGQALRVSSAPKRTATPPSIAEAAELASLQRKVKKPRSSLHRTHSETSEVLSLNQRVASGAIPVTSNPSPMTPDGAGSSTTLAPGVVHQQSLRRKSSYAKPYQSRLQQLRTETDDGKDVHTAEDEEIDEDSQSGPPIYGGKTRKERSFAEDTNLGHSSGAAATPPIADTDFELLPRPAERPRIPLPSILTSSQLDASLPSPSLSPITAAANAAQRQRDLFDAAFAEHNDDNGSVMSGLDLDDESKTQSAASLNSQQSAKAAPIPDFRRTNGVQQPQTTSLAGGPTVMDLPTMVDVFDAMPEAMQTYLIYQFLRRCAKPTLQMVANVVNPSLKCDPFNILPAELGLNITRFLDAKSMCRSAQVSKKWRKLIISDERAWKDLLERDDFVLPKGEIARAVREGWGWQNPGEDGHEQDLSQLVQKTTPEPSDFGDTTTLLGSDGEDTASSIAHLRTKRKSTSRHSTSKKPKRRSAQSAASITKPTSVSSQWRRMLDSAQGPIAFANAAAHAVPPSTHSSVGLSSLKNMHLFKSIYQRHFLIRKAWMMEDSQHQHLAFRAHHRHVVTCLLFDSDKILTGSDDTKINVYDTKTGSLRTRLEGHEGGVWALQYVGDTLVSGSTDRSVRVWDIKSGRCLQVFQGHTSTVRCLEILQPVQIGLEQDGTPIMMPKEPLIITGSRDSTLRVWKLPQPGERGIFHAGPPANDRDNPYFLRTLSGHQNSVRAIAARGDTLISGSYDCTVRVWRISTGDLIHRLQGHSQKVYSVVLDHARNRCISGSMDTLVKVWDLATGACLFNLEGHTSLVGLLDLSHDRLVSAAADSTLRIWDPETGACKANLSAHTGAITCFQHDGQKVISGSDRTLKMWNARNGDVVRDLLTDLSGVWQVRFDERRCVAAVQRNNLTYIEVLDFGASRDGIPAERLGRRIVVDCRGRETEDVDMHAAVDSVEGAAAGAA